MTRGRQITFTKAQIRRAVKGAEDAGLNVTGLIIHPDGAIELRGSADKGAPVTGKTPLASWEDA
jgi:hypothetical protein